MKEFSKLAASALSVAITSGCIDTQGGFAPNIHEVELPVNYCNQAVLVTGNPHGIPREKYAAIIAEICDGVVSLTLDIDQDGYGSEVDCNDSNADVHPRAEEVCNGVDDNCDGEVDNAGPTGSSIPKWAIDMDRDGFAASLSMFALSCENPGEGYRLAAEVASTLDCDDNDPTINSDCTD